MEPCKIYPESIKQLPPEIDGLGHVAVILHCYYRFCLRRAHFDLDNQVSKSNAIESAVNIMEQCCMFTADQNL